MTLGVLNCPMSTPRNRNGGDHPTRQLFSRSQPSTSVDKERPNDDGALADISNYTCTQAKARLGNPRCY